MSRDLAKRLDCLERGDRIVFRLGGLDDQEALPTEELLLILGRHLAHDEPLVLVGERIRVLDHERGVLLSILSDLLLHALLLQDGGLPGVVLQAEPGDDVGHPGWHPERHAAREGVSALHGLGCRAAYPLALGVPLPLDLGCLPGRHVILSDLMVANTTRVVLWCQPC